MASMKDVLTGMQKAYGVNVVGVGVNLDNPTRVPTGIFPFDLATGGGFPRGSISVPYGPESSLKTTLALKAVAMHQKIYPDQACVFVDAEASYNAEWGATLGVDNDSLVYVLPDTAEQVVDMVEGFLYASDCGIVVVDSLAALISSAEIENSAEKAVVGGAGLVVGKLYRKATLALNRARKEGRAPTLIAINQVRHKIGVMHGDPETMPGGWAFKFASAMTVRLYGKDEIDKKVNPVLPAWKVCSGVIKKWKVPIAARNFTFKMATLEREGYRVGDAYDWPTVSAYLKHQGHLEKAEKKGWVCLGQEYATLNDIKARLEADFEFAVGTKALLVEEALENHNLLTED